MNGGSNCSGIAVSQEEVAGGTQPPSLEELQNRISGIDVSQGEMAGSSYQPYPKERRTIILPFVKMDACPSTMSFEEFRELQLAMPTAFKRVTEIDQVKEKRAFRCRNFAIRTKDMQAVAKECEVMQARRLKMQLLLGKESLPERLGTSYGPEDRSLCNPDGSIISFAEMMRDSYNANKHFYAKIALGFFEESQGAEFEIVEALHAGGSVLVVPEDNSELSILAPPDDNNTQEWFHVSFIAKPKNADCADVSPIYVFAELLKDHRTLELNAKYCSTFEPSDDPGFNHSCVICSADQKFHPGADGYRAGHPPCYVPEIIFK